MYKQYFKQAVQLLKEKPFFSVISVLGTALAITLIMVVVLVYQVQNSNYEPEVNRGRMLFVNTLLLERSNGSSYSCLWAPRLAKECFFPLKTPEAVTLISTYKQILATNTDQTKRFKCDQVQTDEAFWKAFRFRFLAGKPFTQSDVTGNIKQAVLAETTARTLFSSAKEAIGQTVVLARKPYTVCGVVRDVSPIAQNAYAQVWIPCPASALTEVINEETMQGLSGAYHVMILARSSSDFPTIRTEINRQIQRENAGLRTWKINLLGQPDTQFTQRLRIWSNIALDVTKAIRPYLIALLIILLVPAINLSGLTSSGMQARMSELGIRKAFGATRGMLFRQVITENLVLTLLGGITGLGLSYLAIYYLKNWLFNSYDLAYTNSALSLESGMLIQPLTFFYALLLCLLLNLLSAGIPAWWASRQSIVNSLNEK
ncbi:ABC transporter permease [Parabacteroides sp. Marseille-P3160]|uniref:ABC transporter permease n=1 Tax=Parabacteroides sp. Marseille-P3160 TaxID=1917887 RepID=UPI0009BA5E95|nr:ABC transporter permease [Parabacteroides sp. Marseille-P3160]